MYAHASDRLILRHITRPVTMLLKVSFIKKNLNLLMRFTCYHMPIHIEETNHEKILNIASICCICQFMEPCSILSSVFSIPDGTENSEIGELQIDE